MIVKDVLRNNKVQIALIQESKLRSMSDKIAREVWGGRSTKWVCLGAVAQQEV